MTSRHIVATRDGNQELAGLEERAGGLQTTWGQGGYAWSDPAAIPPPGLFNQQRAGVMVTQHTMLQVDVVFTALRVISNTIIKMGDLWPYTEALSPDNIRYRKYQGNQYNILTDTFGGGNSGGVGGAMMQCTGRDRTVWSMGLFGEAFWYVLDRETKAKTAGLPSAVEVLHPAFMEVKADEGRPVYVYGSGNDATELDPDDVIHIPFKSMPMARRALSPITYAGVAGALAMAAYEFGSAWFAQGASPSFLLSTDQKLGQAEVERIAQKFIIEHGGLAAAHLPVVVDSGLQVQKISATPDEAQYLHTLEYARNVIASWFGIPPSLLGNALERQTPMPPHTSEEETDRFLQYTLSGYTVPLEEAHSGFLPKSVKAAFNETALSKPDAMFLAQLITALRQAQVGTVNDLRTRYLGWAPSDDPAADQVMSPLASNTAPAQTATPAGSDSKPQLPAGKESPGSDEARALAWLTQRLRSYEQHALEAGTA